MILACPSCSTRYLVDPQALGARGRLVRCSNCAHTWHQIPPEDAPHQIEVDEPAPEEIDPPSLSSEDRIQLPAALASQRRVPWVAVGWLVLLLVVAGLAAGAVWEHDRIVQLWPPAARLYQLAGFPEAQPANDWYNIKAEPRRDEENGVPRLVIDGELINNSAVAQDVPKLKVELHDAENRVVQSWTFGITEERLLPGASVPFTTSVVRPNESATGMTVTLAGKGE